MSCTSTKRNPNPGTASGSVKTKTSSAPKSGSISKYFLQETTLKSPQRNDSLTEMDDFKTPKAINKISKIAKTKAAKNPKKRNKKNSCVTPLQKFMENNLKHTDVNCDHLQMALALSESSYQAENPNQSNLQEQTELFRQAFEKYGFGYTKNKLFTENKREQNDSTKRNKKSKFRYVTPILKIRNEEERQALISSKVTLILSQNEHICSGNPLVNDNEIFSELLKLQQTEPNLIKLQRMPLQELNKENRFWVNELGLEICQSTCGKLLKDWKKIAGRDFSPERENNSCTKLETFSLNLEEDKENCSNFSSLNDETIILNESFSLDYFNSRNCGRKTEIIRSLSPDLFEEENSILVKPIELIEEENELKTSLDEDTECRTSTNSEETSWGEKNEEKLNTSNEDTTKLNLEPICISDDELNDFKEPETSDSEKKMRFNFSKDYLEESVSGFSLDNELETNLNPKRFEKISSSDDDLNSSPSKKKTQYSFSDDEEFLTELSLEERIKSKSNALGETQSPSKKFEDFMTISQESIYISDDELNYSSAFGLGNNVKNSFSDDDFTVEESLEQRIKAKTTKSTEEDTKNLEHNFSEDDLTVEESLEQRIKGQTPKNSEEDTNNFEQNFSEDDLTVEESLEQRIEAKTITYSGQTETPKNNSNYIVKTSGVTPMANYEQMDSPEITKELDKFGLKPLKRQKGVKLLKYIYDSTHPLVADEEGKVVKKRRTEVVSMEIEDEECLFFEKSQSKRIASCQIPLHIVWYNFVMNNPRIQENILLYEPLQLEVLHEMIKEQGFKFKIQDLLTFLDKKCITFWTSQGRDYGKNLRR